MSASQSNLSSTGFDYVVAVTQDSINANLAEYLYGGLPEAILCYVYDDNNNPVPIDFGTFVAGAGNTDPFTVPGGTPATDPRIQNLNNAGFAFAVKARLGLPPGIAPASLPPIVALQPGQSSVLYTMMFAEFVATELVFGPRNSVIWVNQSQPYGQSWTFSGEVDLDFDDAAFAGLPQAVQDRLSGIGDPAMLSVAQLYYDLNSTALQRQFKFTEVPPNGLLNEFMAGDFVGTYWKALNGSEVLGYGAKQLTTPSPASIAVTGLNFFIPDAVGTSGAPLTLNYLCATGDDPLPGTASADFGWNWVDSTEADQYSGVAALRRTTLAGYLNNAETPAGTLLAYASSNCYVPWVRVTYVGDSNVEYQWGMGAGQLFRPYYPPSGASLLHYSFGSGTASDQAGDDGFWGEMKMSSNYDMDVSVHGNQIVITQHLVVWTYVRYLATSDSGYIVNREITDTYDIGVDDSGRITATMAGSTTSDNSQNPSANGFLNWWADVDSLSGDVAQWAQSCSATSLSSVPLSFVENFVFPGGGTFSFTDAAFSDSQDLVAHITYAAAR